MSTHKDILSMVMGAVEAELEAQKDDLTEEQKEAVANNMRHLTEEMLALAMAGDETRKEYHRKNIAHYQAALLSISGIVRLRAHQATINIIGRVLGGIIIATGKTLI